MLINQCNHQLSHEMFSTTKESSLYTWKKMHSLETEGCYQHLQCDKSLARNLLFRETLKTSNMSNTIDRSALESSLGNFTKAGFFVLMVEVETWDARLRVKNGVTSYLQTVTVQRSNISYSVSVDGNNSHYDYFWSIETLKKHIACLL